MSLTRPGRSRPTSSRNPRCHDDTLEMSSVLVNFAGVTLPGSGVIRFRKFSPFGSFVIEVRGANFLTLNVDT